jgi:tetratricopeptide (TPR) repeat protein
MRPLSGAVENEARPLQRVAQEQPASDLDAALAHWRHRILRAPAHPVAYLAAARALRAAKRLDEAEAVASEGLRGAAGGRFLLQTEMARIAEMRADPALALQRWQGIVDAYPRQGVGYAGVGRALMKLDRLDSADAFIRSACARLPDDTDLMRLAAHVAAARRQWNDALFRWDQVLARLPGDAGAVRGRGAVLWQQNTVQAGPAGETTRAGEAAAGLAEAGLAEAGGGGIVEVGRVADPVAHALLMQFESLGQNCEFGLVQRRFGAEPLGLLRWAFVQPLQLAHLLETRFAGLGEPDNVALERTPWGEYCVRDTACNLEFHTFQTQDIGDAAVFLDKQGRRLRWLREKLLTDLAEAAKIFVYKPLLPLPDAHAARLQRALAQLGPARLLLVERAAGGVVPGSATLERGLLRGHLSVINPVVKGRWDIPFDEWLSVCQQAAVLAGSLAS